MNMSCIWKMCGFFGLSSQFYNSMSRNRTLLTLSGRGGGGGLRGPDGQTHSCQSETSYPMMPKLGDF